MGTIIEAPKFKAKKQTVTFYATSADPTQFPPFAYALADHVPGHVKVVAYVVACDTVEAMLLARNCFNVSMVDSVEDGWASIQRAPLRGTITNPVQEGLWSSIRSLFG